MHQIFTWKVVVQNLSSELSFFYTAHSSSCTYMYLDVFRPQDRLIRKQN